MASPINNTIDIWINALRSYELDTLQAKPDKNSWSLGQVYMHILADTNFYIEQIEYCLTHNENQSEQMTDFAVALFSNNEFPDIKIKGDASASETMPQPTNKNDVTYQMILLRDQLNLLSARVSSTSSVGKTKHPGLGYFNAQEWLRFSEIHMRHHLRQKRRIEQALGINLQTES
jgi:hypothetical protein